jgi:glycine cleavage system H lipoate-binding protein
MIAVLVILTIGVFVVVEAVLRWTARRQPNPQPGEHRAMETPAFAPELLPGLFVHSGHTWMEILRSGHVRVGVDEFARRALGGVDEVELPRVGERVRQGDPMVVLARGAQRLTLPAPVSGTVEQCQDAIANDEQPAHAWVCDLVPSRLGYELGQLRVADAATQWMRQEIRRLADWISVEPSTAAGTAYQDGGSPVDGFLAHLDAGACRDFQGRFLDGGRRDTSAGSDPVS